MTFVASPSAGVTGYNMYRAPCTGTVTANVCSAEGTFAKLNTVTFTTLTYTDTTVTAGSLYSYYATAVCPTCNPAESGGSNHLGVTVPKDAPLPPSNLALTSVTRNSTGANTTLTARWVNGTATTYTVSAGGTVLSSAAAFNATGNYTAVWGGKVKPGTPLTFRVCDLGGTCVSRTL